ncbi:MAG: HAD-IB family hydrolase [Muribaculaceae bacterium]|nr:HAD-IB family hydrolase [Muribaculaceae bacterium]
MNQPDARYAFFDFDGTLTRHDSFMRFCVFCTGRRRVGMALIRCLPWLIGWQVGIIPGGKAKERLIAALFKGKSHEWLREQGERFAYEIEKDLNGPVMERMKGHISRGDRVAIVSASLRDWIEPWARRHGINCVLATELADDSDGLLTGKFLKPNCLGPEKARRIRELIGDDREALIWAYGNSAGDNEMLALATHPCRVDSSGKTDDFRRSELDI